MSSPSSRNWTDVTFADIVEDSAFGPRFSGDAYTDDGNISTLRTTDISENGRISYETMPRAKLDETRFAKHFLLVNDLVITRSGRVGTTAIFDGYPEPVLPGAFLIRFRLRENADPRFFRYWFNSRSGQQRLLSVARGAAQQNINITNVKMLKVPLPPIAVQRDIAFILSAYDDLIENNRRRIQLLEQSARLLYKEWFVHLRFPGHEHVKIKNGVPDGWVKKTLDDLTSVVTKGTTPTTLGKAFVDEGLHFIKVESISDSGSIIRDKLARVDEDTHNLLKRSKLIEGDILFSIAGAIGRSAIVPMWVIPANTNQAIAIIRPIDYKIRYYLYWVIRSDDFLSFSMGRVVQIAQANVSLAALKSASIIMPVDSIINSFIEIVTPIHKQIDCLNLEIILATEARDLLLPRLMNGMITV